MKRCTFLFFVFYGSAGKKASGSLLALLWFDGLWFDGASPDGLGCRDGGWFLRISAVASHRVAGGGGVVRRLPHLVEARHFVDLRRLQLLLLLLLFGEELVSGLEHLSPLFGLQAEEEKEKS